MNATVSPWEPEHWSMVVLYDADTGDLIHVHQSVTYKGGTHPDERSLERDAVEALEQASGEALAVTKRNISLLHVDPRSLKSQTEYKVDTTKRVLIEIGRRPAFESRTRRRPPDHMG